MRCTAPMNAPCPPPTMPSRMRPVKRSLRPSIGITAPFLRRGAPSEPERELVGLDVGRAAREVVEGVLGDADDVALDEGRALGRPLLGMLDRALPLEHRPAVVVVLRELREDRREVDLAVAQGA